MNSLNNFSVRGGGGGGGRVFPEKLGRGVRSTSQSSYPFMTKIYDICYPIYYLAKNSIPYL